MTADNDERCDDRCDVDSRVLDDVTDCRDDGRSLADVTNSDADLYIVWYVRAYYMYMYIHVTIIK